MSQKDTTQILTRVPLFCELSERHLKKIAGRFRERSYKPGEVIVEQGKMGVGMFVVVSGEVEVKRFHSDGTSVHVSTLGETEFFGELSLLDDAPRSASVIALQDTTCLALAKLDFLDELQDEPEIAVEMLKALAHRLRGMLVQL